MDAAQSRPRLTLLKNVQAFLPQEQFDRILVLLHDNPGQLSDKVYFQVHQLMREHFLSQKQGGESCDSNLECLARIFPQTPRGFIREQLELFQDLPDHLAIVLRVLLNDEVKYRREIPDEHENAKQEGKRSPIDAAEDNPAKVRRISEEENAPLNWSAETVIWNPADLERDPAKTSVFGLDSIQEQIVYDLIDGCIVPATPPQNPASSLPNPTSPLLCPASPLANPASPLPTSTSPVAKPTSPSPKPASSSAPPAGSWSFPANETKPDSSLSPDSSTIAPAINRAACNSEAGLNRFPGSPDVPDKIENNLPSAVPADSLQDQSSKPGLPAAATAQLKVAKMDDSDDDLADYESDLSGSGLLDDDMWMGVDEEVERFDLITHLAEVTGLDNVKIAGACNRVGVNIWRRPDAFSYNALMDHLLDPPAERVKTGAIPVQSANSHVMDDATIKRLKQECKTLIDLTTPVKSERRITRSVFPNAAVQPDDQAATLPFDKNRKNQKNDRAAIRVASVPRICVNRAPSGEYFVASSNSASVTNNNNNNNGPATRSAGTVVTANHQAGIAGTVTVVSAASSGAVSSVTTRSVASSSAASSSGATIITIGEPVAAASSSVIVSNKIDTNLVNRLCEIFPDAAPDYIRGICKGRVMENGAVDDLITVILDSNGQYPKRPPRQPDPEISPADQFDLLNEFLPDADPDYLRMLCDTHKRDPGQLKVVIAEAIERRDYPTLKEYQRRQQLSAQQKQYTTDFKVEEFLKVIPNPDEFFADPKRTGSKLEQFDLAAHYACIDLRNRFDKLPVRRIQQVFAHSGQKYLESYRKLESMNSDPNNWNRSRRKPTPLPGNITNIPLLQEIAYVEHMAEIRLVLDQRKLEEMKEVEQARAMNSMVTCQCCYDDEVLPKNTFKCENGCSFCRSCIVKSTEVVYGEGKSDYPCLNSCSATFGLQVLQAALSPKFFSKVAQKKTMAEVKAAGIDDLETCPFCDFATIPPEGDKIFSCLNPECMKQSCRLCKEPSHIPLRCEEIEKDDDVKARVFMENKMTEALLRKCYKCGIKFYKEEGCNKMTCSCGAMMCYVCNQPVINYKHFNGQGGDRFDLCPLYSDTNELHKVNVLKGAEEARAELGDKELKVDPTKDLEDHFKNNAAARQRHRHQDLLAQLGRHQVAGLGGPAAHAANPLVIRQGRVPQQQEARRHPHAAAANVFVNGNVDRVQLQAYVQDMMAQLNDHRHRHRHHPHYHHHEDHNY